MSMKPQLRWKGVRLWPTFQCRHSAFNLAQIRYNTTWLYWRYDDWRLWKQTVTKYVKCVMRKKKAYSDFNHYVTDLFILIEENTQPTRKVCQILPISTSSVSLYFPVVLMQTSTLSSRIIDVLLAVLCFTFPPFVALKSYLNVLLKRGAWAFYWNKCLCHKKNQKERTFILTWQLTWTGHTLRGTAAGVLYI